jgi:hypothetical protein
LSCVSGMVIEIYSQVKLDEDLAEFDQLTLDVGRSGYGYCVRRGTWCYSCR